MRSEVEESDEHDSCELAEKGTDLCSTYIHTLHALYLYIHDKHTYVHAYNIHTYMATTHICLRTYTHAYICGRKKDILTSS